ncbi:YggT family protein [Romeria aff. gracilis LEGE 07310]|uniref:YggT family protein n=1 Tax=Vasconcelosia minhoensis LEGE 07310 TaxID=915328 RepID=A0A8J7DS86_9CYAN|nr:YggT family protein [Romeria gracilis]MBE9079804.1 YggT family protein [Romeria aff. gracilis LEGE 07310]
MTQPPYRPEDDRSGQERRSAIAQRNAALARTISIIYYLAGALEILLLLRFILRIAGANPDNAFARVIYGLSNIFVAPFANLFQTPVLDPDQAFDINALIALVVYALLAWLVARLVWIIWSDNP